MEFDTTQSRRRVDDSQRNIADLRLSIAAMTNVKAKEQAEALLLQLEAIRNKAFVEHALCVKRAAGIS